MITAAELLKKLSALVEGDEGEALTLIDAALEEQYRRGYTDGDNDGYRDGHRECDE